MALEKLKKVRDELKEISANQKQVRTNKIKGLVKTIDEEINELDNRQGEPEAVTPNTDPEKNPENKIPNILQSLTDEEKECLFELLDKNDLKKENKYLKRKSTMYELKIEKLNNKIKEMKKEIKG